jgi:hypothetical protein
MNNRNPQTPFQEALSVIGIASVLVGLGCYVAAINEVPVVSEFLFSVAVQVYHRLPVLNALHAPQAPMLVAALNDRNGLLHLHYPAGTLVGGRFQSSWHQEHGTSDRAVKEAASRAKNTKAQ